MSKSSIWKYVEEIILSHWKKLASMSMRDAFYYIREILVQEYLRKGKITIEDLDHYDKNYEYLRDDVFVRIEREYDIPRPKVKDFAVFIDRFGIQRPIEELLYVNLSKYRGIIFVEKAGAGEQLKPLAKMGYIIVPSGGQGGFPQRVVRKVFKEVDLPILVLHDHDTAGDWIARTFAIGSKRTKHLDLLIPKERVIDLGLTKEDVKKLDLPPIPEAPKYRKKRKERWELSSLEVLSARYGISNPLLSFTIAKMVKLGFRLYPIPKPKIELAKESLYSVIMSTIEYYIRDIVNEAVEKYGHSLKGEAVEGYAPEILLPRIEELERVIDDIVYKEIDRIRWVTAEEEERRIANSMDVQTILKLLNR